jgi:hypothetical protein
MRLLPLGVEVGRRFAFYGDVLCKRGEERDGKGTVEGWRGGGSRRGRRLAILGDSVDTMGSQYITSPNPDSCLSPRLPLSLCLHLRVSPAHLSGPRLRSGTNEAPRCRNSLGAGVIAATAFLERVIVQQRRNGIARERRWWLEGRQRDGRAWFSPAADAGEEDAKRRRC